MKLFLAVFAGFGWFLLNPSPACAGPKCSDYFGDLSNRIPWVAAKNLIYSVKIELVHEVTGQSVYTFPEEWFTARQGDSINASIPLSEWFPLLSFSNGLHKFAKVEIRAGQAYRRTGEVTIGVYEGEAQFFKGSMSFKNETTMNLSTSSMAGYTIRATAGWVPARSVQ